MYLQCSCPTLTIQICHTPDIPGKFDAEKAAKLGLPKGPKYGMLTQGKSVTTDDGRVIHPSDCIAPAIPGAVFIVIECPTFEHFVQIEKIGVFNNYMTDAKYGKDLAFIIRIYFGNCL
jgi:ribonuclease Z